MKRWTRRGLVALAALLVLVATTVTVAFRDEDRVRSIRHGV
jgi:hypothetical protein